MALFELRLRRTLEQLEQVDKPLLLSETGFPSAVGYHMEGERLVVPESDNLRYGEVMHEFLALIRRVNADYGGRIKAIYFYEWRDNLHHSKIWNVEQSPIHVAFGLCDRLGVPKFDIKGLRVFGISRGKATYGGTPIRQIGDSLQGQGKDVGIEL